MSQLKRPGAAFRTASCLSPGRGRHQDRHIAASRVSLDTRPICKLRVLQLAWRYPTISKAGHRERTCCAAGPTAAGTGHARATAGDDPDRQTDDHIGTASSGADRLLFGGLPSRCLSGVFGDTPG